MAHSHEHSHGHEYEPDHEHDEEHDELQHCIEECLNCHAVCTMTAQYCLTEGGEHADVNLIGVLLDCAAWSIPRMTSEKATQRHELVGVRGPVERDVEPELRQRSSFMIVMRVIPFQVPTVESLHLPPVIAKLAEAERGMLLVTGVTGSGKSSTLAAMVNTINATMHKHIVTLEQCSICHNGA